IGLGAAGLFAVGGPYWPWNHAFHLRAGFGRIHGVEVGTRVRVQGMDVGEVEAIQRPVQPGSPVVLRLRLKEEFRDLVRADAVARIVSEGMVGGKVVEIDPGSTADTLPDDGLIATRPTADLSDVLAQASSTLQGLREGDGTLAKLARDPEAYQALLGAIKQ